MSCSSLRTVTFWPLTSPTPSSCPAAFAETVTISSSDARSRTTSALSILIVLATRRSVVAVVRPQPLPVHRGERGSGHGTRGLGGALPRTRRTAAGRRTGTPRTEALQSVAEKRSRTHSNRCRVAGYHRDAPARQRQEPANRPALQESGSVRACSRLRLHLAFELAHALRARREQEQRTGDDHRAAPARRSTLAHRSGARPVMSPHTTTAPAPTKQNDRRELLVEQAQHEDRHGEREREQRADPGLR